LFLGRVPGPQYDNKMIYLTLAITIKQHNVKPSMISEKYDVKKQVENAEGMKYPQLDQDPFVREI